MKTLILVLSVFCGLAQAQLIGYNSTVVFNNKTYVDSQVDTSGEVSQKGTYLTFNFGGADRVEYQLQAGDSISVICQFKYRTAGATSYTAVAAAAGDTIVTTAAGYGAVQLRSNTVERIPGVATEVLVVSTFSASDNSANSGARYTTRLRYK